MEYLTDQLIPYIGNKRKLLPLIRSAIELTQKGNSSLSHPYSRTGAAPFFCDLFAGSGVVSRLAKTMGFRVLANDWEPYSECINRAYVATNTLPAFANLGGIEKAFAELNALLGERGYIATHYCPADDEHYDTTRERMFYTQENGRRIDAMRGQIARWRESHKIDAVEESVLLAPLIYQASYCSNTSGVFKGFHNGWGGATKTAWYRIRSFLTIRPPLLFDNGVENVVTCEDASALADRIECDVAYIDPPYNQHQYGSNYHLLNTVALWDKPPISEFISGNGARDKAAIRKDWRVLRRSPYCYRSTALAEFEGLLSRLRAHWVLVSYSTDGIIETGELLRSLGRLGSLEVVTRQYKRYRVSSQRPSPRPHTVEFVVVVDTAKPCGQDDVSRAVERVIGSGKQRAEGRDYD